MCGIAGIIGKHSLPTISEILETLNCIRYRGPDDMGTWQEGNLLLGQVRLAIIDLSEGGKQPMTYNERYILVFNGEIYNYVELRNELQEKGYHFHTHTDSEVIPAAYDYWGEACQEHMNGMWAFALFDRQKQTLFCSRDRFGIKPFYYIDTEERFAFGSEIKQLLPQTGRPPRANNTTLSVFLATGYLDYSEETMFDGVSQLRGGHCLTYNLNTHHQRVRCWFTMNSVSTRQEAGKISAERFRIEFEKAIRRHMRADVPIGSCLSGGLDSSAIVCMANRLLSEKGETEVQHTVSSCFDNRRFDEREYIDAVLAQCSGVQRNQVFPNLDEVLDKLDEIVWHMDEPFSSMSIFAQWNVFQEAHRIGLTVMLDGQGADEQLAGYTDFYKLNFAWLFRQFRFKRLYREIKAYINLRASSESQSQLRFLAVILYETMIPLWLQNRIYWFYLKKDAGHRWIKLGNEALDAVCRIKRQYAKRDPRAYCKASMEIGLSELLHYEDRNSMAFSVEARVPFLDADLAAEIYGIPFENKLKNGATKWVMREGLADILPEKICSRYDKMGFVTPENEWLMEHHDELEPKIREAAKRLSPLVDLDETMRWYRSATTIHNGDFRIWRLLCAGHWAEVFGVEVSQIEAR